MLSYVKGLTCGGLMLSVALVSPALAQDAPVQDAPVSGAADQAVQDDQGVQDIVVTAQRRSDSLQKTPIAITALSPSDLTDRNIRTTQDLMQVTPSLQVSTQTSGNGGGSATFFLRGMGQQRTNNGTSPAVGIYIDDFYYPSVQGAVFSILDLERVEVLRGPQGTLFGRNTIGGAIRYVTKKPEIGEDSAYAMATLGSYGRLDLTGGINLSLGKMAALRITAGRLRTDGYVRQQNGGPDAGKSKTDLIRGQLLLTPTANLSIDLSAQYSTNNLYGFTYKVPGPILATSGVPAVWNRLPQNANNQYDNRYASTCDYCQAGTNRPEFSAVKYASASATIEWALADGISVKSLTGWQRVRSGYVKDLDGSPLPIADTSFSAIDRSFSQELQLSGDSLDHSLRWTLGGYLYRERHFDLYPDAGPQLSLGSPVQPTLLTGRTNTEAVFADATLALSSKLTVLGGARYSQDRKNVFIENLAGARITTASGTFGSATWRVGAQYQWNAETMTYATVSRGFRAGGFAKVTAAGTLLDPFDPEYATNFEVGTRVDLFNRRLRLNPTIFYTRWTDVQVQNIVPGGTGIQIFVDNAASAHSKGFELEAEAKPTNNLRLFGNIALLDIKYDRIGNTTTITLNSKFQRAPAVTYSVGATYQLPISDEVRLATTVNWSYQSSQRSTPSNADSLFLPAYGLLNARVELGNSRHGWSVAVFATNLLDKTYYVGGANYANAGQGAAQLDLGRPREFGVGGRLAF